MKKNGHPSIGPLAASQLNAAVARLQEWAAKLETAQTRLSIHQHEVLALCRKHGLDWAKIQKGETQITVEGEILASGALPNQEKNHD